MILRNDTIRQRAIDWIKKAPDGTRVEFKREKRSTAQSDKMWACLSDIASQADWNGVKYTSDQWKVMLMDLLGHEMVFLPSLAGKGFTPYGQRSSDLSREEMSNLIELMISWGTERGVVFHDVEMSDAHS